jgi:hypothetical protein
MSYHEKTDFKINIKTDFKSKIKHNHTITNFQTPLVPKKQREKLEEVFFFLHRFPKHNINGTTMTLLLTFLSYKSSIPVLVSYYVNKFCSNQI